MACRLASGARSQLQSEKGKEIVLAFAVYLVILVLLSVPFVVLDWPPGLGWFEWPYRMWPFTVAR